MLSKLLKKNVKFILSKQTLNFSSIAIRNGTIVNADRKFLGDVLINDNLIQQVAEPGALNIPKGTREIDATGKYVIPGGIDPHCHMQMPFMGTVAVDDFNVGTQACVAGGTTSFIDFVIPSKGESLMEAYKKWRGWADPKVNCDYMLHCALTYWNEDVKKEMDQILAEGINSFKTFLAYKGALMVDDTELYQICKKAKQLGAVVTTHCENGHIIAEAQKDLLDRGLTGPEFHYYSRPDIIEAEATNRAITIAQMLRTPIYIVHVMSQKAGEVVQRAKSEGYPVYAESMASAIATDGNQCFHPDFSHAAAHIMSPPLQIDPQAKLKTMHLLSSGVLDTTGSDNCTFKKAQKMMGKDDFSKIPNGVNGLEDRMSVIWQCGVNKGYLSPCDFVKVTSTNAAKIFNVYPQKGVIQAGSDADVVIWNPEKKKTISAKTHHHNVDFNIFEGFQVQGVADITISRGNVVWENETLKTVQGSGKYIKRKPFGPIFDRIANYTKTLDPAQFKVDRK